ncbi:DUF2807 domain-containing protein [Mediterranea sp. An20]|jgi:hypothetical protein|uniref:head GIN domain-containing protein n=1 Tax=Mediterranea sp. An20 TaxID=1965586 RepID=UPI000B36B619|nr:head GIN domain-containing protein [Mediterranea sp. An20]OUP11223.1 DUF2807 domain-containing protein [Mediterranea sp. An20]
MKATFCIALAAFALTSCMTNAQSWGSKRIKESKNYVTKEIKVDNFNKISLIGSPTVNFTQKAGKPQVRVYTSDNIAEVLNIYEKGGTLYVGFKKGYSVSYTKLNIDISAETLNSISLSGSGDINLKNGVKTDRLVLSLSGSGDINGSHIRCQELITSMAGSGDIELSDVSSSTTKVSIAGSGDIALKALSASFVKSSIAGSGDIVLDGQADEASYSVAGSGDMHAVNLKAKRVNASVSGSGSVKCYASDYLKARTTGSGSIGYKGNPQELDLPRKNIYEL